MSGKTGTTKCSYCRRPFETDGKKQCPACREEMRQKNEQWEKAVQKEGYNMALYHARKEARLSRRALAKLAGVSESSYSKCESGELDLSEPKRARVARVLKKPVEALWEHPYRVRCRNCLSSFTPVKGEMVCPQCREDARRTAQRARAQAPGANQKLLAQDCRKAMEAGYGHHYGLWRAGVII